MPPNKNTFVGHIGLENESKYLCGVTKHLTEVPADNRVMCWTCSKAILALYNRLVD